MNKILVTGGAGFIGSNLIEALANDKQIAEKAKPQIVVVDNLFLGRKEFIAKYIENGTVEFNQIDLLDSGALSGVFDRHKFDLVFHLAANSDISYGRKHTDWDLKQGTLATYNLLECMRKGGAKKLVFASSSAIYGDAGRHIIHEDFGPLLPISFYGASKLACEGLISSYSHNYEIQSWIYRFGNIVGKNSTHGVLFDFIHKLKTNSARLEILGDGKQSKPYLHVDDCVKGMLFGYKNAHDEVNYFNLACEGATTVDDIAGMVISGMGLGSVSIEYSGGKRGWPGDVPQVRLDPSKLDTLGWKASRTSDQAVGEAVRDILEHN